MDLLQSINDLKEERVYLISIIVACISIILFVFKIPHREIIVIGAFLIFTIVLLFKVLK